MVVFRVTRFDDLAEAQEAKFDVPFGISGGNGTGACEGTDDFDDIYRSGNIMSKNSSNQLDDTGYWSVHKHSSPGDWAWLVWRLG